MRRAVVLSMVLSAACSAQVSPFEDVEWTERGLSRVMVAGRWWEPVSIDGLAIEELYVFALGEYRRDWLAQKRLDEDLLEVFERMGRPAPGETVRLQLRPVGGGEIVELPAVPMTRENRHRLWQKRDAAEEAAEQARRPPDPPPLTEQTLAAALAEAGRVLAEHHSYSAARGIDPRELLAGAGTSPAEAARAVQRVLAASGDGHARLGGPLAAAAEREALERGVLPFALMPLDLRPGGRVVAVWPDGRGLVSDAHPLVSSIDGVPIERWLGVAAEVAPGGSPQSRRYGACNAAASVGWIRERLGLEPSGSVELGLTSERGGGETVRLELAATRARGLRRHAGDDAAERAEALDGRIAYVPIESMWRSEQLGDDDDAVRAFERALERADQAEAVLIDIRGNTGGTRDILHLIASRIMAPDAEPVVYSAARVLMWPGRDAAVVAGQLRGRYLHPLRDARWSDKEQAAIDAFLARFEPEVALDDDRFGPWHVSVLSPTPGGGAWAGKPVAVLMDERCISASDVFLAAMGELPGVTLIGRPSRGASGMSIQRSFADVGALRISTMVSFMPDGRLFDWHGVGPDIPAELTARDFTRAGPDTALDAAVRHLRARLGDG